MFTTLRRIDEGSSARRRIQDTHIAPDSSRLSAAPLSNVRWETYFSSFGPQRLKNTESAPTIGRAARPDQINRACHSRTGLIGWAQPVEPYRRGIPSQHLHRAWNPSTEPENWIERPGFGKVPVRAPASNVPPPPHREHLPAAIEGRLLKADPSCDRISLPYSRISSG